MDLEKENQRGQYTVWPGLKGTISKGLCGINIQRLEGMI